ncbi:golgin subfamily A member 6-like protein 22 [Culicoides brevitarsis]|uniref:golgin subfamily A member 6-like protein 22 n=1 Tax=Culicoides brevitarsis TaxID=469753 RepID=UPI00307B8F6F
MDLLKRVDKACLKNKIDKLVEESLRARDREINLKREKLKHLFNVEDDFYRKESQDKLSAKIEAEMLDRRNKILAMKQAKEKEHHDYLKQKKIQQYMANCDEIRPFLRKQLLVDSKACQRMQMEEHRKQKQAAKETQNLWLEIASRSNKALHEKEKQQRLARKLYDNCTAKFLKEQMLEKQNNLQKYAEMTEEQKRNEESLMKENELALLEKKVALEKRMQLAADLKEQLLQAEKERIVRKANEDALNKLFNDTIRKEIEQEIAAKKGHKENWKQETLHYLNYMEKIRKEKLMEQAQKDKLVDDYRIKQELEYIDKCRAEIAKKRAFHEMVYETQRKQIKEKRELQKAMEDSEFKKVAEERASYDHKAHVRAEKWRQRQAAKEYARALKEQEELRKLEQKQFKERQEAELHKILAEQRICEVQAKQFVDANIDVLPPHPHTKLLHNNSNSHCQHATDHIKISNIA